MGRGFCPGKHRSLFRGAYVHAPVCVSLRVQYPQDYERAPACCPLGYFDTHATGELRRIVDGCAASTETLLAHMLPDIAGATAMVVGLLVLLFALDWRLGVACLISVAISFGAMATMMSGKGAEFMKAYMGALVKMNKTGTEYVRGIPVVKVFQQTVYLL